MIFLQESQERKIFDETQDDFLAVGSGFTVGAGFSVRKGCG
jgi:hypothetical protein